LICLWLCVTISYAIVPPLSLTLVADEAPTLGRSTDCEIAFLSLSEMGNIHETAMSSSSLLDLNKHRSSACLPLHGWWHVHNSKFCVSPPISGRKLTAYISYSLGILSAN
jgi:hypothetical protein